MKRAAVIATALALAAPTLGCGETADTSAPGASVDDLESEVVDLTRRVDELEGTPTPDDLQGQLDDLEARLTELEEITVPAEEMADPSAIADEIDALRSLIDDLDLRVRELESVLE